MSEAIDENTQQPDKNGSKEDDSINTNSSSGNDPKKQASAESVDSAEAEVVVVDGEDEKKGKSDAPPSISSSSTIAQTEPYNHQKQQEIARRNIAYWLVGIVALIVAMSFIYLWILPLNINTRRYVENLILVLQILFAPLITLTGTAIGYYFGANSKKK